MNRFVKGLMVGTVAALLATSGAFAECYYTPQMEAATDQEPQLDEVFFQTAAEVNAVRWASGCYSYASGRNIQGSVELLTDPNQDAGRPLYVGISEDSTYDGWEAYLDQTHPAFWSILEDASRGAEIAPQAVFLIFHLKGMFGGDNGTLGGPRPSMVPFLGLEDSEDYAKILIHNYVITQDLGGMPLTWVSARLGDCYSNFSPETCAAHASGDLTNELKNGRMTYYNASHIRAFEGYSNRLAAR